MDFKPSIDDVRGVWSQYLLQGNGREEFEELRSRVHTVIILIRKRERDRRGYILFIALTSEIEKRMRIHHKTHRHTKNTNNVSNGFLPTGRTIANDTVVLPLVS